MIGFRGKIAVVATESASYTTRKPILDTLDWTNPIRLRISSAMIRSSSEVDVVVVASVVGANCSRIDPEDWRTCHYCRYIPYPKTILVPNRIRRWNRDRRNCCSCRFGRSNGNCYSNCIDYNETSSRYNANRSSCNCPRSVAAAAVVVVESPCGFWESSWVWAAEPAYKRPFWEAEPVCNRRNGICPRREREGNRRTGIDYRWSGIRVLETRLGYSIGCWRTKPNRCCCSVVVVVGNKCHKRRRKLTF